MYVILLTLQTDTSNINLDMYLITSPTNRHAKYKLGYVFNITNPTNRHVKYKLGYVFNYKPYKQTRQI